MLLDSDYWNKRYLTDDFGWDAGRVTTPLKTYIDQLRNKDLKILIPGAGNSYEAEYLIENGFRNVFVMDFAAEPLQNLAKRCASFPKQNLIQQDFFKHSETYDLIIEQTFFCAIDPASRAAYAKQAALLLRTGGKIVGVLFDCEFEKKGPPFGGSKNEYHKYFSPYFEFKTFEACYNSIKPREGRELFINLERK